MKLLIVLLGLIALFGVAQCDISFAHEGLVEAVPDAVGAVSGLGDAQAAVEVADALDGHVQVGADEEEHDKAEDEHSEEEDGDHVVPAEVSVGDDDEALADDSSDEQEDSEEDEEESMKQAALAVAENMLEGKDDDDDDEEDDEDEDAGEAALETEDSRRRRRKSRKSSRRVTRRKTTRRTSRKTTRRSSSRKTSRRSSKKSSRRSSKKTSRRKSSRRSSSKKSSRRQRKERKGDSNPLRGFDGGMHGKAFRKLVFKYLKMMIRMAQQRQMMAMGGGASPFGAMGAGPAVLGNFGGVPTQQGIFNPLAGGLQPQQQPFGPNPFAQSMLMPLPFPNAAPAAGPAGAPQVIHHFLHPSFMMGGAAPQATLVHHVINPIGGLPNPFAAPLNPFAFGMGGLGGMDQGSAGALALLGGI